MSAPALADLALPSTDEEIWRYSRIDDLDVGLFAPATRTEGIPAGAAAVLEALGERAGAVVVRNGHIVHTELDETLAGKGVSLGGAALDPLEQPTDVFADLTARVSGDAVRLVVPSGLTLDRPVVVVDWIDADRAAVHPRLAVELGADAQVQVVDWHGSDDVEAFASPLIELEVAQAARLGYLNVQDRGERVWQIASQLSSVERDATLTAAQAVLGGDYARTRADCRLVGRGATGNLVAAYFGHGNQTLDFRTFQDHVAPDTTSNLLFKGALDGSARSIYTGTIRVDKGARGTNAFQTNRNLKLSEHAWAESVPNLEIENNDVRCSHASTVGPVDESQLFYLESRGVPTLAAERLIVAGFFDEVLDQLPVRAAAELVDAAIDRRLEDGS